MNLLSPQYLRTMFTSGTAWGPGRATEVGVAIGAKTLAAVVTRPAVAGPKMEAIHRRDLRGGPDEGAWPELAGVLSELRDRLSLARGATIDIGLLAPLAHTKVIALPPLPRWRLRSLMVREAPRWFLNPGEEPIADAAPLEPTLFRRRPCQCVAISCARPVAEAVVRACGEANLSPGMLTSGTYALTVAARRLAGPLDASLVTRWRDVAEECVVLTEGRLRSVLVLGAGPEPPRAPRGRGDRERTAARPRTVVLPNPPVSGPRSRPDDGSAVRGPDESLSDHPVPWPADALIAFGSLISRDDAPQLRARHAIDAWRRRIRIRAGSLLAAAALAVVLWTGVYLHLVRARAMSERALAERLAPAAQEVLEDQRLVADISGATSTLENLRHANALLLRQFGALAQRLPASAYFESLRLTPVGGQATGIARAPATLEPVLARSSSIDDVAISSVGAADPASGGRSFTLSFRFTGTANEEPGHGPR